MKDNQRNLIFIIVGVLVVAIFAVIVFGRKGPVVSEPTKNVAEVVSDQELDASENVEVVEETSVRVTEIPQEEIQEAAVEAPILKTELVSTDPSTVVLANDDIQLIELFAFW